MVKKRMLLREWHGLRCRLRGRIVTKGGAVAEAGAVGVVKTDSGTKATFEVRACDHCRLTFYVRGLDLFELPSLFDILDRAEPAKEPKKRR